MPRKSKQKTTGPRGQRPYWRGHLKLSLVTCPIAIYSAVTDKEDLHLHFINPDTGNRIKYQVVDAETGDELARSDLVRGYEYAKGRYVALTEDELKDLKVESSDTVTVEHFVDAAEIPPIYFDKAYYVLPDGPIGEDAYAVIRDAMAKSDKFALSRVVFSRRERVIALRAESGGIVAYTLREASDIRPMSEFFDDLAGKKSSADMQAIARQLIETKSTKFEPEDLEDRYEARVRELVNAKLEGVDLEEEEPPRRGGENVVDLMDALKKSLAGGRRESGGKREAATVHRLPHGKKPRAKSASKRTTRRATRKPSRKAG